MVKSNLDFSDKPFVTPIAVGVLSREKDFYGVEELKCHSIEISGLWWTILPQLWIQLQIVYSRLKAQLQQILTLVHILSSLSELNSEQFEQLFVGMPCLHNQLHLQPNIFTFNQWERIASHLLCSDWLRQSLTKSSHWILARR